MITQTTEIGFNNKYLTLDGEPWFPIMGEIHYSRVQRGDWKEELLKMKAGGVDIVSAYTIWIHHEEIEGKFDFTGQKDLRAFVETIQECGMSMILRIGPWAHGEARNGGFPDWLMEKEKCGKMTLRCNDEAYLKEVSSYYKKIFEQVSGLLHKDGGPIIGIQIENEYGHCGGFGGEVGEAHMRTLQQMAKETGFEVPLYTATGWGGAVTGGMLPVMGGYCEAPWDQRLTDIEPSGNYIFTKERNDHAIGSDHGIGEGITFDMDKFPYLTAELGGGLQVTKHRRPVATADDIAAMSMVKMGSGCNLLGYYMYHGGTNPDSQLTTIQETKETGYPNDLPIRSYDFNAPIKEYGQLTDTYRQIRKLALFIHDFGDRLCMMDMIDQPGNPSKPENSTDLRTSVRYNPETGEGYLFVNNYQRRMKMAEHNNVALKAYAADGKTVLADWASTDIHDGDYFFRPFNMPLGETLLLRASATPLCIIHGGGDDGKDVYVFYTDDPQGPNYVFEDPDKAPGILTLTGEQALMAQKVVIDGQEELLVGGEDLITDEKGRIFGLSREDEAEFNEASDAQEESDAFSPFVWDDTEESPADGSDSEEDAEENASEEEEFDYFPAFKLDEDTRRSFEGKRVYHLHVWDIPEDAEEVIAVFDWAGSAAQVYREREKTWEILEKTVADGTVLPCADQFYTGQTWELDVKRFSKEHKVSLRIEIEPLKEDTPVFLETWPQMVNGEACRIDEIHFEVVRREEV